MMDTSAANVSSDGNLIACPFCFEAFEHVRLVLIHVICRHPGDYYDALKTTASVEEFCSKIPGIRGSVLERKMRKSENEQKQLSTNVVAESPPMQANEINSRNELKEKYETLVKALVDSTTTSSTVPLLLEDINLDINENEASINSSPCGVLLSGSQSVDDGLRGVVQQNVNGLNNLVNFVDNIEVGSDSIISDGTYETSNASSFVDNSSMFLTNLDIGADSRMPVFMNAAPSPIIRPLMQQQQMMMNGNYDLVGHSPMTYVVPDSNFAQMPISYNRSNLDHSNVHMIPSMSMQTSSLVTTNVEPAKKYERKKKLDEQLPYPYSNGGQLQQLFTANNGAAATNLQPPAKKPRGSNKKCAQKIMNDDRLNVNYGALHRLTPISLVKCLLCQKEFGTVEDVFQHESTVHRNDLQRFPCPIMPISNAPEQCLGFFNEINQVHNHLQSHHTLPPDMPNARRTLQCCWCDVTFTSPMQFFEHVQNEYRDRRMSLIRETMRQTISAKCKKCKQTFVSEAVWYRHRGEACYSDEPEAARNLELAMQEFHLSRTVNRSGCSHNRQVCAYYPACYSCPHAHPICPSDQNCRIQNCMDDHRNRKRYCGFPECRLIGGPVRI